MLNNTETGITKPFDPSDIDVEKKNMPVNTLIAMLQNDMIDLEPAFQRKSDLWDEIKQSRLIESLLLKLPLPSMYFQRSASNGKYIVIDGLQRLCALRNFAVTKELHLKGLEFLGEYYENAGYDDLTFPERLSIGMEEIVVNIFKGSTPDEAKFIIFKRLNSGGTSLNAQEIRNALFQGAGSELIRYVTGCPEFVSIGFNSKRMQDRAAALRFYAFFNLGYLAYNGRMESYLNQAIEHLNATVSDIASSAGIILDAIERAWKLFDDNPYLFPGIVNAPFKKAKPSLSFFDVLSVNVAKLSDVEFGRLLACRQEFVDLLEDTIRGNKLFNEALSQKSDRKAHTHYRYEIMDELIHKLIDA